MKKNSQGQSLIEVLAALSAAVVVVAGITIAVVSALNNAEFSKNQNMATQFAQQGMELMRAMRNNDYGTFRALQGSYCLDASCNAIVPTPGALCGPKTSQYSCGQNIQSFYVREVTVDQTNPVATDCNKNAYKVTVNVSWTDTKCTSTQNNFCHTVAVSSCLSDYNVVPTP